MGSGGGSGERPSDPGDWDEALERLEDFILAYPRARALPDLATIMRRARVDERFLREDERARKVLHEAVAGRPLSDFQQVDRLRTEVELLTLELEVLADQLAAGDVGDDAGATAARLQRVRRRLRQIKGQL